VSRGSFGIFLSRPYSLIALITAATFLILPVIPFLRKKREILISADDQG